MFVFIHFLLILISCSEGTLANGAQTSTLTLSEPVTEVGDATFTCGITIQNQESRVDTDVPLKTFEIR